MSITNKDQLCKGVAERSGLSSGDAKKAVEATLEEVAAQLAEGNEIRLTGFGKFWVSHRPARTGRNPQTGDVIQIEAREVPKFSPGAGLKQAVG